MSGWKTWTGGLALIASGAAMVLAAVSGDTIDTAALMQGLAMIGAGFTAIGIGHKVEKAGNGVR